MFQGDPSYDALGTTTTKRESKHKLPHGDETYFARYFLWCGHVARMTVIDPMRETNRLFVHKNMEWLRNLKKEVGTQCHGRRLTVWMWEQAVAQCVGTDLTKVPQDRAEWRSKVNDMTEWKKQKMADRSVIDFE